MMFVVKVQQCICIEHLPNCRFVSVQLFQEELYFLCSVCSAWLQGVHFEPQSPSAAVTAANAPVVLHHPTATAVVAPPPARPQQQSMVLTGPLQPPNLVESNPDLTMLPTPPSMSNTAPLSPMTIPGFHMSPVSLHQTIVTNSSALPSRQSSYPSGRGATYHFQAAPAAAGNGAESANLLVPGGPPAAPQTILTAHPTGNQQVSSQISPLTTPPSSAPTFYAFNHPSSPYTSGQHAQ